MLLLNTLHSPRSVPLEVAQTRSHRSIDSNYYIYTASSPCTKWEIHFKHSSLFPQWRDGPINPRWRQKANFLLLPLLPILRSRQVSSWWILRRKHHRIRMRTSAHLGPTVITRDNSNLLAITYGRMITWRLERRLKWLRTASLCFCRQNRAYSSNGIRALPGRP